MIDWLIDWLIDTLFHIHILRNFFAFASDFFSAICIAWAWTTRKPTRRCWNWPVRLRSSASTGGSVHGAPLTFLAAVTHWLVWWKKRWLRWRRPSRKSRRSAAAKYPSTKAAAVKVVLRRHRRWIHGVPPLRWGMVSRPRKRKHVPLHPLWKRKNVPQRNRKLNRRNKLLGLSVMLWITISLINDQYIYWLLGNSEALLFSRGFPLLFFHQMFLVWLAFLLVLLFPPYRPHKLALRFWLSALFGSFESSFADVKEHFDSFLSW